MGGSNRQRCTAAVLTTTAVTLYILAFFVFELGEARTSGSVLQLAATEAILFLAMICYARHRPLGIELPFCGFVTALVIYLLVLCSPLAPFTVNPTVQQVLSRVALGGMAAFGLALLGDMVLSFRSKTAQPIVIVGFVCAIMLILVGTMLPAATASFVRVALFPLYLLTVTVFLLRRERLNVEHVPSHDPVAPSANSSQPGIFSLLALNQGSGALPYMASLLLMFAFGVFGGISNESTTPTVPDTVSWAVVLAVCIALLFATTRKNVRAWSHGIFVVVFVLCIATMPLAVGHFHVPYALLMAMFVFAQIPIWLFLVDVSTHNSYPPAFLFSLFTIPPILSYALGCATLYIPGVAQAGDSDGPTAQIVMVIMAVICIAAVVTALGREHRSHGNIASAEKPNTERTSTALDMLCARYELSERDRTIVGLYTQGRDVPFISTKLHVAQSTVKTHLRSIYNKMGIHSKQELIDALQHLR